MPTQVLGHATEQVRLAILERLAFNDYFELPAADDSLPLPFATETVREVEVWP